MESFGAYLKANRENKGIRLEEIASITKIHLHALELLESSQWDRLPPEPFIRGFIIAYAKYVGLNTEEVLGRYTQATHPEPSHPEVNPAAAEKRPAKGGTPQEIMTQVRLPSAPKLIAAASLLVVGGLAALLITVGRQSDTPEVTSNDAPPLNEASVATAEVPKDVKEERKLAEVDTTPKTQPSTAVAHEVVIEGKERTWLKVVIDENPPVEYFLGEGKSVTYRATHKIKVVLGNSTGTRVVHNGKPVDGKQFMGTIRSYKFPEEARFPQDVPSKRSSASDVAESESASVTP